MANWSPHNSNRSPQAEFGYLKFATGDFTRHRRPPRRESAKFLPQRPPFHLLSRGGVVIFSDRAEMAYRDRTGWLGRQDSNLGMAESKSAALPLGYAPIRGCSRLRTFDDRHIA